MKKQEKIFEKTNIVCAYLSAFRGATGAPQPSNEDPMKQRFSVTSHPRLPIIMISDGYTVTVLRYPHETTCQSLMTSLIAESTRHIRRVHDSHNHGASMFDSMKKQGPAGRRGKKGGLGQHRGSRIQLAAPSGHSGSHAGANEPRMEYMFEEPEEDALDATLDKAVGSRATGSMNGPVQDLGEGRLMFGDLDSMNVTADFVRLAQEDGLATAEHLDRAHRALMTAWSLAVSHTGVWTVDHEDALCLITQNLTRLLALLLHSDTKTLKEMDALMGLKQSGKAGKKHRGLSKVLRTFTSLLHLLQLDSLHRNVQVCVLDLIHSTVTLLSSSPHLQLVQPHGQTLQGCYALLRHSETVLLKTYSSLPGASHCNTVPYAECTRPANSDLFTPSVLSAIIRVPPGPLNAHSSQQTQSKIAQDQSSQSTADIINRDECLKAKTDLALSSVNR